MATRNLFLVRHGQYQTILRDAGRLTDTGMAQAHATADALSAFPCSRIYHSPILRAVQTARLISAGFDSIPLEAVDSLRECIPSIPDGMEHAIRASDPQITPKRAADCAAALDGAYHRLCTPTHNDEDVFEVVVCHGNVIRYLVSLAVDAPVDSWMKMLINHCGITRLLVDSSGMVYLVAHNDTGHLPADLYTQ